MNDVFYIGDRVHCVKLPLKSGYDVVNDNGIIVSSNHDGHYDVRFVNYGLVRNVNKNVLKKMRK